MYIVDSIHEHTKYTSPYPPVVAAAAATDPSRTPKAKARANTRTTKLRITSKAFN